MPEKTTALRDNSSSPMSKSEKERLMRDIYRSDMDKLKLFVRMLNQNALFKKAKVIHK